MEKTYIITRIDEADFGCEGRQPGQEVLDSVWIKDENGTVSIIKQEDRMLYDRNLNEGDMVVFDESGTLQRVENGKPIIETE